MRIEIQIGSDEPTTYPIKNRLMIGSGEGVNIQLPSDAGISRKHLQITIEDENVYVCDMGSTNGSFINEERLGPGTQTEFTSFFPVRLGDSVWVTLLTDDAPAVSTSKLIEPTKAPDKEDKTSNRTKNLALSDINKTSTKTKNLIAEREALKKSMVGKKGKGPSDSSRMTFTILIVIGLLGFAIFYNFYLSPPEVDNSEQVVQAPAPAPAAPAPEASQPVQPPAPKLVPEGSAPSTDIISKAFVDFKCTTSLEKKLCDIVPDALISPGGVVESIDYILVLVPEARWHELTFKLHDPNSDWARKLKLTPAQRTMYLISFFLQSFKQFNWEEIEKNIYFAFYRDKGDGPYVSSLVGIVSGELSKLLKVIPADLVKEMTETKQGQYKLEEYLLTLRVFKTTDEIQPPNNNPAATPPANSPATSLPTPEQDGMRN